MPTASLKVPSPDVWVSTGSDQKSGLLGLDDALVAAVQFAEWHDGEVLEALRGIVARRPTSDGR
jgi:hypothetical protein